MRQAAPECPQRILVLHKIRFADDDPVGHGHLLHRFALRIQRAGAVHGIDNRDHAVEPDLIDQLRVRHDRMQDRRRVGKAGGLDYDAPKRRAGVAAPVEKAQQRIHQIAAYRTAQATVGQFDYALIGGLDEEVVDTDIAEFIDDDCRVGQLRVAEETIEQGRLAAAEKSGDDIPAVPARGGSWVRRRAKRRQRDRAAQPGAFKRRQVVNARQSDCRPPGRHRNIGRRGSAIDGFDVDWAWPEGAAECYDHRFDGLQRGKIARLFHLALQRLGLTPSAACLRVSLRTVFLRLQI